MTKLYQVSLTIFDELDDYVQTNVEAPTTSYDEALEQYEHWRKMSIGTAEEELADEYDDEVPFDVMKHVRFDEADSGFHLTYSRNNALQIYQCAIHVWEIEI